jgi:hypothetical protein
MEQLVVRMAEEEPDMGLSPHPGGSGQSRPYIDKIAVRNILRRHHIDHVPKRRQAGTRWSQFLKMHGEAFLRYAIRCYVCHYHAERNHQGLGHALITREPEVGRIIGRVERRKHLGGLLSYDYREAA